MLHKTFFVCDKKEKIVYICSKVNPINTQS